MEEMIPCAIQDDEVFQRVWQRVMAGRPNESSPIQPGIPGGWEGDVSCGCLRALAQSQGEGLPPECQRQSAAQMPASQSGTQMPAPQSAVQTPASQEELTAPVQPLEDTAVPEPPCPKSAQASQGLPEAEGPHRGNDLPRTWEPPQPADDRTARLRRHVADALEGWQFYRHLAKRARGNQARTLNSMAAEQHKQARRLAAAYFLLTGLRYWPTELLGTPAIASYWGALRSRHQAEQRQESAYRLAGDDWEDAEMTALYTALAEGCQKRCQQLRGLLEQDIT